MNRIQKRITQVILDHYITDMEDIGTDMDVYTDGGFVIDIIQIVLGQEFADKAESWPDKVWDKIWFSIDNDREVKKAVEYRRKKLESLLYRKYDLDIDLDAIDAIFLHKGNLSDFAKRRRH